MNVVSIASVGVPSLSSSFSSSSPTQDDALAVSAVAVGDTHDASSAAQFRGGLSLFVSLWKNLTVYWAVFTAVAIWFLFIHAPPFLRERQVLQWGPTAPPPDVPLAMHLIGAYSLYLTCVFNTLVTPSTWGKTTRALHVWIGRAGMLGGILSFVLGAFVSWSPTRGAKLPPIGFSLGVTIGGVMQVLSQKKGYVAIQKYRDFKQKIEELERCVAAGEDTQELSKRYSHQHCDTEKDRSDSTSELNRKRESEEGENENDVQKEQDTSVSTLLEELKAKRNAHLKTHIFNMIAVFAVGCSAPAVLRIADYAPLPRVLSLVLVVWGCGKSVGPFGMVYTKRIPEAAAAGTTTISNSSDNRG